MEFESNTDWYGEIGELVLASGEDWFSKALQASLQSIFHFDYFMLARYTRAQSIEILAADIVDLHWRRALHWLESENYVIEPIYKLFADHEMPQGIHDMVEITQRFEKTNSAMDDIRRLPHVIEDCEEEIGWRTMGWPIHQQETCIVTHLGNNQLIVVSLFNNGLEVVTRQSESKLKQVYPALGALLCSHYSTAVGTAAFGLKGSPVEIDPTSVAVNQVNTDDVKEFFSHHHQIQVTAKEQAVFSYLLAGATAPVVAETLNMSPHTVRTHRRNVYKRLGNGRLTELINQFHNNPN